jgi:hypothetical protein
MKNKKNKTEKNNKRIIIAVSIFLLAVIILSSALLIATVLNNKNAVMSYGGVSLSAGVCAYLSSFYKYNYLTALSSTVAGASDNENFWSSVSENGKTYGELLSQSTEQYLKETLVAVYLYDSYAKLSREEKNKLSAATKEVLDFKADKDENKFNEIASEFGFTYSDFQRATEILYKSYKAQLMIYGEGGSSLKSFPDLCNAYLKAEYSKVRLLFIRTFDKFVLDDNGNRVIGTDGNDMTVALTDAEKAERLNSVAELDAAILGKETGADASISPEMFSLYQEKYKDDGNTKNLDGYYFSSDSSYTKEFKIAYPTVVSAAISMSPGEYKKVETDEGYCFIYKMETESGAYSDTKSGFFSDFYSLCADFSYADSLKTLSSSVKVLDSYDALSVITIPYNYDLIARVGN